MCSIETLKEAAARLKNANPGDAKTVTAIAERMAKGKASEREIAKAKKLARGVMSRAHR